MLSSISWLQYLAAVIILSLSYYVYLVLHYYRSEIKKIFNGQKNAAPTAVNLQNIPFSVIGAVKPAQVNLIDNEATIHFADATPDQLSGPLTQTTSAKPPILEQPFPTEELEIEAGKLIEAFKDADDKSGFPQLLKILIEPYKRVPNQADLQAVIPRILRDVKERLSFSLTLSDLGLNGNN